jgi:hypothetical protein
MPPGGTGDTCGTLIIFLEFINNCHTLKRERHLCGPIGEVSGVLYLNMVKQFGRFPGTGKALATDELFV